jgi:hypothetical protein
LGLAVAIHPRRAAGLVDDAALLDEGVAHLRDARTVVAPEDGIEDAQRLVRIVEARVDRFELLLESAL